MILAPGLRQLAQVSTIEQAVHAKLISESLYLMINQRQDFRTFLQHVIECVSFGLPSEHSPSKSALQEILHNFSIGTSNDEDVQPGTVAQLARVILRQMALELSRTVFTRYGSIKMPSLEDGEYPRLLQDESTELILVRPNEVNRHLFYTRLLLLAPSSLIRQLSNGI